MNKTTSIPGAFLLACLLCLASCQREPQLPPDAEAPQATFTASLEGSLVQSKMTLADGDGFRATTWSADDRIVISGNEFSVTGAVRAGFADFTGTAPAQADTYYGYYPVSLYGGGTPQLAASLTHTEGRIDHLPMLAYSSSQNMHFTNLCALLAVQLVGDETVGSIRVRSTTKYLAGPLNIAWNVATSGIPQIESIITDHATLPASQTVTLNLGSGVQLGYTPKEFLIPIPPQAYPARDLVIEALDTAGNVLVSFLSVKALTPARGKYYVVTNKDKLYFESFEDIVWEITTNSLEDISWDSDINTLEGIDWN